MSTQERILANALNHFCSYGYNGTSVREITAASQVTKPTLYYYFKNKEDLYTRLAQSCFSMVISQLEEVSKTDKDFKGGVEALFRCMDQVAAKNPAALKLIHGMVVAPQRGAPE